MFLTINKSAKSNRINSILGKISLLISKILEGGGRFIKKILFSSFKTPIKKIGTEIIKFGY